MDRIAVCHLYQRSLQESEDMLNAGAPDESTVSVLILIDSIFMSIAAVQ